MLRAVTVRWLPAEPLEPRLLADSGLATVPRDLVVMDDTPRKEGRPAGTEWSGGAVGSGTRRWSVAGPGRPGEEVRGPCRGCPGLQRNPPAPFPLRLRLPSYRGGRPLLWQAAAALLTGGGGGGNL